METPCLGVYCEQRSNCAHYNAVEFADMNSIRWYFCAKDKEGKRTLFKPMFIAKQQKAHKDRRSQFGAL